MTKPFLSETNESLFASAEPIERVLLATLLDNLSLLRTVSEIIEPDDFFNEASKTIFAWLKAEDRAGHMVDSAVAMSHFAGDQRVEPHLFDILSNLPSPNAIKRQAEELRELSLRHETIKALQKTIGSLATGEGLVQHELSKMSRFIQSSNQRLISNENSTKSFSAVGQIWKGKFARRVAGDVSYTETGYADLDKIILGLEPEDLIIIGARPSMGKTTFAMNIAENAALQKGKSVMVFSMEMPCDAIYQRSLSSIGGVDYEDLRAGKLKVGDFEKVELAIETLDGANIYIDDTPALSLEQLCARAHRRNEECRQNEEQEIGLIVIDYLQLMQVAKHNLGNRNEGIGEISRGLKQLARDLKCPVIALSQLSRNLEQRPNKRPMNSDLRDSGSIEQDADVIMFVYRDEVYNEDSPQKGIVEIIIGKQRNGPLGTAFLSFAKGQSRFCSLSEEQNARLAGLEKQEEKKAKGGSSPKGFSKKEIAASVANYEAEGGNFSNLLPGAGHPDLPESNQEHLANVRDQLA